MSLNQFWVPYLAIAGCWCSCTVKSVNFVEYFKRPFTRMHTRCLMLIMHRTYEYLTSTENSMFSFSQWTTEQCIYIHFIYVVDWPWGPIRNEWEFSTPLPEEFLFKAFISYHIYSLLIYIFFSHILSFVHISLLHPLISFHCPRLTFPYNTITKWTF